MVGLKDLHKLTSEGNYGLQVDLKDFSNNCFVAVYEHFRVMLCIHILISYICRTYFVNRSFLNNGIAGIASPPSSNSPRTDGYMRECNSRQNIRSSHFISSVRSSNSHPDLLVTHHPLFQITPVLNTGLSLSEPQQLYQGQSLDSSAGYMYTLWVQHDITAR